MGDAFGAGMGPMGCGKRIVDEQVGQIRQLLGEGRIVGFIAGVEAGVFQHRHIAVVQGVDRLLGRDADAILGKAHLAAQHLREGVGHRLERHFRHPLALRPVEMAAHDDMCAFVREFPDRRAEPFDPGEVGDFAVPHRDVEVGAQQHALAGDIHPIQCAERHDQRLPNSAAVSDIRLEKPHSLSYQLITRASCPSTTAVCVASKVEEAGLWLKSTLTSGAVL